MWISYRTAQQLSRACNLPRLLAGLIALIAAVTIHSGAALAASSYYLSSSSGSDSNPCTQASPCQSLSRASSLSLNPGDNVLFKSGDMWSGGLVLGQSGSSAGGRITVESYGSGNKPKITGGNSGDCIKVNASFYTITSLETDSCGYAGTEITGTDTTVEQMYATGNSVGIQVDSGTSNVLITSNELVNNNILNVNTPAGSSGAFGVLLNGPAVVTNNTIHGDYTPSQAYGWDGSGVELYNASNASVHNNLLYDNDNEIELGGSGSGNTIEYNVMYSDSRLADQRTSGIVLPGSVTGTRISHNSIDVTGNTSEGIVCYNACAGNDTFTSNAVAATTRALDTDSGSISVTGNVFNGTIQGITPDGTNSTATIGWVSPPSNLHETAGSPTIDHATVTNLSTDFDSNPVPDVAGTPSDSGAYEYQGSPPTVVTGSASAVGSDSALVSGSVNPSGVATTYHFEYGTSTKYGSQSSDQSLNAGTTSQSVSATLSGLSPGTTYHYRLVATNVSGTTNGSDQMFMTTEPSLSASPTSVAGGGSVTASWSGVANPTSQDWIAVYAVGAPNSAYQNWLFDDSCTHSAGATTAASGSCQITMPTTGGTYELRLFANDSYTLIATSQPITVTAASLSGTPTSVAGGGSVTASWSGVANPTSQDWIAVYAVGAPNSAYQNWLFDDSCTDSAGATTAASGSCQITMPTTGGTYELRLFANDSYTLIATSQPITVTAASLSGTPTSVAGGGSVTASWSGVANPTSQDWIAVYAVGAPNSAYQNWLFDDSCTDSAGATTAASGSCQITMPTTSGTYELRLFANNSYTLIATSQPITVTAASLSGTPTSVAGGGSVTASWSGVANPTSQDWIAVYAVGAPNSAYQNWLFDDNCTHSAGATTAASGSCQITMPTTSGTYELRLFANNSYNLLATSQTITVTTIQHVAWVLMENHSYSQIIGDTTDAPYINSLANTYGLATNYFALSHPSLPNYIGLTSGSTQGITDDDGPPSHPMAVPSIFSQLSGGGSRSLQESMPSNCDTSDYTSGSGTYYVHHNPEAYYTNLGNACSNYDVPFGSSPDLSASFTFVTPNGIDDMHDGTIAQGDNFLKAYIPALMATPQYQAGNTVIFIVWDEDSSCSGCTNQVPLIVVSPQTHGVKDSTSFSHYSLLKTTEDLLGLPELGGAQTANTMVGHFGLSTG